MERCHSTCNEFLKKKKKIASHFLKHVNLFFKKKLSIVLFLLLYFHAWAWYTFQCFHPWGKEYAC